MECADLAKALGGILISFRQGPAGFSSVSIDSRTVTPGALFVALIGAAQDGHQYVKAAFEKGAVAALIARSRLEDTDLNLEEAAQKRSGILLAVENTLKGLQDAAAYYLERFPRLLKIGITGSSGKTTVKEIAGAMISREKAVVMNPGNLNSETGLPLSVFTARPFHEVGIFELGMNRHGEIEEITKVLKPHIALITNIGSAHIGFFGSNYAIAEEKKAIFSQFTGTELALIPGDDPYRDILARGIRGRTVFYDSQAEVQDRGIEGFEIVWDGLPARFKLPGKHNLHNAFAAAAIAAAVPVRPQSIREGLESASALFGRSEVLQGPVTVIRDCYNANPESMQAAIELCDALENAGRRIYVIGAMLELGAESRNAHETLGRRLTASKADLICLYGDETLPAEKILRAEGRISCFHTNNIEALASYLSDYLQTGDTVLLKGSRGCALERLTGVLLPGGR
jgi:UDP-N-acetylmuramoyl-tripeptide--D-alanyl-D-alanine ligase